MGFYVNPPERNQGSISGSLWPGNRCTLQMAEPSRRLVAGHSGRQWTLYGRSNLLFQGGIRGIH
jgi:hypothetical protein